VIHFKCTWTALTFAPQPHIDYCFTLFVDITNVSGFGRKSSTRGPTSKCKKKKFTNDFPYDLLSAFIWVFACNPACVWHCCQKYWWRLISFRIYVLWDEFTSTWGSAHKQRKSLSPRFPALPGPHKELSVELNLGQHFIKCNRCLGRSSPRLENCICGLLCHNGTKLW